MGNKNSAPIKFDKLRRNYIAGISNKENFNIDQIFVTLIMKLAYYQAKNKLLDKVLVYESSAYSNSVNDFYFELPMTIDYISGMKITNKGKERSKQEYIGKVNVMD